MIEDYLLYMQISKEFILVLCRGHVFVESIQADSKIPGLPDSWSKIPNVLVLYIRYQKFGYENFKSLFLKMSDITIKQMVLKEQ